MAKWREEMKTPVQVNSLTRRKPKKAVQQAAQNIAWSIDGAESAEKRTPVSRLVIGRRISVGEERERPMPRNNRASREAPRVGSGEPRQYATSGRQRCWRRLMAEPDAETEPATLQTALAATQT